MSSDRLIRLCDELASSGVRAVIFIGGGEPLVHASTPDAIARLLDRDVRVGMVTNGTHLDRLGDPALRGLAWTRVSMDAGTQETYDRVRPSRGRSVFPRVVANVANAARAGARVGYSFVALGPTARTSNVKDIVPATRLAKALGCAYIEFKAQLDPEHHVERWPREHVEELRACLEEAADEGTPEFTILRSSSLLALLAGRHAQPKPYSWCPSTHIRTLVTPTGLYTCAYHRGDARHKIGDVTDATFGDAWSQADHLRADPSRHCDFHCARHGVNQHMLGEGLRDGDLETGGGDEVDVFV